MRIIYAKPIPKPEPCNEPLWKDFSTFFRELAREQPGVDHYFLPVELMVDLEARFKRTYDIQEIANLMEMGSAFIAGKGYEFKYEDFTTTKNY